MRQKAPSNPSVTQKHTHTDQWYTGQWQASAPQTRAERDWSLIECPGLIPVSAHTYTHTQTYRKTETL